MANVQKYTKGNVQGLSIHWDRKTENHANKDIDNSRSHLNYDLCKKEGDSLSRLNERLKEVHCLNRKDVKHCACWVVTLPGDLKGKTPEEQRLFFKKTYAFLTNRYGGEKNVITATVHNDETTPHMHFAFVPTMFDVKRNIDKVCAKKVVSRKDLSSFHGDLDTFLKAEIPHIYQGGILNDKTIGIDDVKLLKKHNEEIQEKKEVLESKKEKVEKAIESVNKKFEKIKVERKKLNDIESKIADCFDVEKELQIFEASFETNIFGMGNKFIVKKEDMKELKKYMNGVAKQAVKDADTVYRQNRQISKLEETVERQEKQLNLNVNRIDKLNDKIHEMKDEIKHLEIKADKAQEVINVFQSVLKEKGVMQITQVEYDAHLVLHKVEHNQCPQTSRVCKDWDEKLEKGAEIGRFNENRLKNAFQNLKTWFNELLQKEQNRNKDRGCEL